MHKVKQLVAFGMALLMLAPASMFASSHREAPITALDRTADITDWYAFVSYDHPDRVTMILNVDPFLEPSNGPNYFPFDPNVLYEMKVDNNQDGIEDVTFQFRFNTEIRQPGLFTGFVGDIAGIPADHFVRRTRIRGVEPAPDLQRVHGEKREVHMSYLRPDDCLPCLPMWGPGPCLTTTSLFNQGIYSLANNVRVFAGTVDDPFFIDLGAAFDSLNFRMGVGGVLPPAEDADDTHNYAPDAVAGFNVNSIVLEVPITMLTVDGKIHPATDKQAVIGTYGTTSRRQIAVRRSPLPEKDLGPFQQVQREGNPLINELIIGTGSKDRFSMDDPKHDSQFSDFFLNPVLAGVFSSIGIPVASNPRTDLLILAQYEPPICPGCGSGDVGPIADLLRLNTGIPPTPVGSQKRLGFLAGDSAGYPNGRRPIDDVVDISSRAVAGILVDPIKFGTPIGDGVQLNPEGYGVTFPYVMPANSGRNSVHIGPGQAGCTGQTNGICPVN